MLARFPAQDRVQTWLDRHLELVAQLRQEGNLGAGR
jgi:hypothetical protein